MTKIINSNNLILPNHNSNSKLINLSQFKKMKIKTDGKFYNLLAQAPLHKFLRCMIQN